MRHKIKMVITKFWKTIIPFVILFVLTLFSIGINGYFFGYSSQGSFLVVQNAELDNNLFQNDIIIEVIPYFYTYFYKIMALPSKIFGLQNAYFFSFFASMYFLHIMIFYLARTLFKKTSVAYLSVLLLLVNMPIISTLKFNIFVQRVLIFPFLLLSIYLFLKEEYILSFIIVGLSMNLHVTTALPVFFMFFLYFIVFYKKIGMKKIIQSLALFFLLSLPVVLWSLKNPTVELMPPQEWWDVISIQFLHHIAPLSWSPFKWVRGFSFVLVFLLALKYKPDNKEKHKKIMIFIFAIIILCVSATFFYYVVPISTLVTVQFWRSTKFFGVFAMIYASNYLLKIYKKSLYYKVASTGLAASLFLSNFKGIFLFILLIFALKYKKNLKIFYTLIITFLVILFLSIFGSVYNLPYLFIFELGFLPTIIIFLSVLLMLVYEYSKVYIKKEISKQTIISMFILIIIIFSLGGVLLVRKQLPDPTIGSIFEHIMVGFEYEGKKPITFSTIAQLISHPYKFLEHNVHFPNSIELTNWTKLQLWVKYNTDRDSIFITPPYLIAFRTFSERAIVMEWDDVGWVNFNVPIGLRLFERIKTLCNSKLIGECVEGKCTELCRVRYNEFTEEDFIKLVKKYKADYIVIEKPKKLNFNLIYENNRFRVYRINLNS